MFTKPLVFVLGAGVSAPFGFPVGRQMKDAICNGGYHATSGKHIVTLPPQDMADVIGYAMGNGDDSGVAKEFVDAFRSADLYSIDAWLEANQSNHHFQRAGKAAIATVLMNAEFLAKENGAAVDEDWFAWLWNHLWTPDIDDITKNNVWFITFNYDRLLEWKFERQVHNTYLRASDDQKASALAFLRKRVIHVHGLLGGQANDRQLAAFARSYLRQITHGGNGDLVARKASYGELAKILAKDISIVSEQAADRKIIDNAAHVVQQNIWNQEGRLVFLGFSYDERNILKLDLDRMAQSAPASEEKDVHLRIEYSKIIGSAMGVKRGERTTIEEMFKGAIALGGPDADAVEFCRSYIRVPSVRMRPSGGAPA